MIQIISGSAGSGKSRQLIEIANQAVEKETGFVVYIDDDKRYMYDLKREIRFVDATDYKAFSGYTAETFFAFVSGMLAGNFDITLICIDALLKLTGTTVDQLERVFDELKIISEKNSCSFVISMNMEKEALPESLRAYCI